MKDKVNLKFMIKLLNKMVEGLENQNGYFCLFFKVFGYFICKLFFNYLDIFVDIVIENGFILDVFGLVELVGFDFSYVRCLVFKFEKIIVLLDVWFRKFDGIIGKLLIVLDIFGRLDCKIDIILSIGRFILFI